MQVAHRGIQLVALQALRMLVSAGRLSARTPATSRMPHLHMICIDMLIPEPERSP